MRTNIVLTGFMGTGKTTIGRRISDLMNMEFLDLDVWIENQQGLKIQEIFEQYGEEAFRNMEKEAVQKTVQVRHTVIATGGGIVLNPQNMSLLNQNGLIICLKSNVDTILRNISHQTNRPLLDREDKAVVIKNMLEQREKYYLFNDLAVDVSELTVEQAAQIICSYYQEQEKNDGC